MSEHHHDHGPSAQEVVTDSHLRKKLAIAFGLVFSIVLVQAIGAFVTGSLALLVDVVHSFADSLGLFIALVTGILMGRPANKHRTWGYRRLEVLSALVQATMLAGISVFAFVEAVDRWRHPPEVEGVHLLGFAIIALMLNLAAAAVLHSRRDANFNMKAAFLEVAMDSLGTMAVIMSAVVMMVTGFDRADAIAAVVIALLMFPRAFVLIRQTLAVLMEFTPEGLDLDEVRKHILAQDHVVGVHDLHASTISTGLVQLSAHVAIEPECFIDGCATETLLRLQECVADHFPVPIKHSTFQLESAEYVNKCVLPD